MSKIFKTLPDGTVRLRHLTVYFAMVFASTLFGHFAPGVTMLVFNKMPSNKTLCFAVFQKLTRSIATKFSYDYL